MIMKVVRWAYWSIRMVFFSQGRVSERMPGFFVNPFLIIYLLVCKFAV